MSIAELKRIADNLSARDRQWLRAYLFAKDRSESSAWKEEMGKRRRKMQAGKGVSAAEMTSVCGASETG